MAENGQIIDGKYVILTYIDGGGMSKVYLARDIRLNKQWAVKEIRKDAGGRNTAINVQSAIAEANMIKQLDHNAIVRIVDIIDKPDVIYIIEDFIEGFTLEKVFLDKGVQSQEDVIKWGIQVCDALDYLHNRKPPIIYRDMKPANIMLKPDGNIKLIDFGIAREYKDNKSRDTVVLGTREYAAPEQYGGGQTDARTDIYCLGMTMYELLTGKNKAKPPYKPVPIRQWNPQLDPGLEAVIEKCVQYKPEDRYQTCAELQYALLHYKEQGEEYRRKQKGKLKRFFGFVAASIICLLIGITGIVMKFHTNSLDYNQNINLAENATDKGTKVEYYEKAIELRPDEIDAYLGLINTFKEDAAFSVDEEAVLEEAINTNIVKLKKEKMYPDLAFEIGKLYWYYYDYGKDQTTDNQITRMKNAISWFDDAANIGGEETSYYTMSKVYSDIGKFNRDITLNMEEASDKGSYLVYWNNLKNLVYTVISDGEENEIIELEVYKLTMFSMETYVRKFKADSVEYLDMTSVFETVKDAVKDTGASTDKTNQMKKEIISHFDGVEEAIENAYRKRGR